MLNDKVLVYPVIFSEYNDEDGHYFTVTSPNISGMVTEGSDRVLAVESAIDAIATMIDGEEKYPEPQDPSEWILATNQTVVYISVNMSEWYREKEKYVKSEMVDLTVTIPEYLNSLVRDQNIDLSKLVTEVLKQKLLNT
jgi:predicted RNase H-like HicB family nuclease